MEYDYDYVIVGAGAAGCVLANRPGKVLDRTLPLDKVAEGYRAMDERLAVKTLLQV